MARHPERSRIYQCHHFDSTRWDYFEPRDDDIVIDMAEVHDATAFGELAQYENLGFCAEGEGGPYAASGATALGGARPINPCGGLESKGHPVGATGLAMVAECFYQLRGQASARQVEGARLAMIENGGGFLGQGEAAIVMSILEGPSS